MLGVLANVGLIATTLSGDEGDAPGTYRIDVQEVGALPLNFQKAEPKRLDTQRYDVLQGFNDMSGREEVRWWNTNDNKLPDCGKYEVFTDPRAADFCD